jgi:bifunctional DNA-binding transcriptional regulator/antitoxin component of YhaV-PrlF toxin-antitoxin module
MSEQEPLRFRAFLDAKGRLVIPIEIRRKLGLKKDSVLQGELYGKPPNKILLEVLAR